MWELSAGLFLGWAVAKKPPDHPLKAPTNNSPTYPLVRWRFCEASISKIVLVSVWALDMYTGGFCYPWTEADELIPMCPAETIPFKMLHSSSAQGLEHNPWA